MEFEEHEMLYENADFMIQGKPYYGEDSSSVETEVDDIENYKKLEITTSNDRSNHISDYEPLQPTLSRKNVRVEVPKKKISIVTNLLFVMLAINVLFTIAAVVAFAVILQNKFTESSEQFGTLGANFARFNDSLSAITKQLNSVETAFNSNEWLGSIESDIEHLHSQITNNITTFRNQFNSEVDNLYSHINNSSLENCYYQTYSESCSGNSPVDNVWNCTTDRLVQLNQNVSCRKNTDHLCVEGC